MADLKLLLIELKDEQDELDRILEALDEPSWDLPTPAAGWSVRDQVSHLAFFDEAATTAVADPERFTESLSEIAADIEAFMKQPLVHGRRLPPQGVRDRWATARRSMLETFASLQGSERIPWYGPPMSPASFISARLMETWAHGQDVVDAVGMQRTPTDRLRHIAFIGYRARSFSYSANGMTQPAEDVCVTLELPSGEKWSAGAPEGGSVRGTALDFALVVTQRRHLDDTRLDVSGPAAEEWMSIAQCFAGPPGEGRRAGQFPRTQ